ncbi:S-layer homology domain-containing protein [Arthrobacter sp. CAL618]|uniref:S-layer homology domain-containing protein n=1 Tax=Arthrobacter sp. CAL618 TaxID=1055770 RepID=UPI000415E711|nr:S-layer homology domain-containing protein [Arthrobacter sp. CAL618]
MPFSIHARRGVASAAIFLMTIPLLSFGPANAVGPSEGPVLAAEGSFTDVRNDNLFYKEISWLAIEGISTGYADGTFRPLQPVNRDAMAAFMYRLAGEPHYVPPASSPFRDVTTRTQFYKEISWLASKKISTGYTDRTFRPVQPVNRDAMAAFMYRLAGSPSYAAPATARFSDVGKTDQFYKEISWLASKKISEGWPDKTYRPIQPVNRDAMSAFMYRYAGSPSSIPNPPSGPNLSEQRIALRERVAAAKKLYVDSRPFVSSLARADGLIVKGSIEVGIKELGKAEALVTAANTQPLMTAASQALDTESLRAGTVKTSATQLKALKDLRPIQQTVAKTALSDLNAKRVSGSAYQATKARGEAFTTLLASDRAAQRNVIGKAVPSAKVLAPGYRDELTGHTGTIPTASGWVGFFGGCALPQAETKFLPRLPANGPGIITTNKMVADANSRAAADPALGATHDLMIRGASSQAARTLSIDQLRAEVGSRVPRIGYGWLQAGDTKSRDVLRSDAKRVLESGPESINSLTASNLLLASATASDWASTSGLEETVLVRWLGPQTCLHADRDNFVDAPTNIAAIHNAATFVASAVYLEKSPLQASALAKESLLSIQPALKAITTDGGTPEGPGYWTYQSRALSTLYSTLPNVYTTIPIAMPSLAKTPNYAVNSVNPLGIPSPFADARPATLSPLMPAWAAFVSKDPGAAAWAWKEFQAKPDAHLMWWWTKPGALPAQKSAIFPQTGLAVLHLPAGNPPSTVTLKGGDNAANHAHLDIGTATYFKKGVEWSVDPGTELVYPAGYFGETSRWSFWKPGTAAHSTLLVGQSNQPTGAKGATKLISSSSASVDMRQALPGSSSATRTVTNNNGSMVISDVVRATAGIPLTWQWVTDASVTVDASRNLVTMKLNGQQTTIQFGGVPSGARLTAAPAPEKSSTGAALTVIRLEMSKVTVLNLNATIK